MGDARVIQRLVALLLGVAAALADPAVVGAGSGGPVSLPQGTTKIKNRLRVDIDTHWVDANGYRPIRVTATNWPPGPTAADRSFRFELRPRSWEFGDAAQSVTFFLEMPQGAPTASTTVSVPQYCGWQDFELQVYEDGFLLEDLSGHFAIPSRTTTGWSEAFPAVLIVDADAKVPYRSLPVPGPVPVRPPSARRLPDVRALATRLPAVAYYGNPSPGIPLGNAIDDDDTERLLYDLPRVVMLPPASLPDRWLDYSCFDLVFLSREDLGQLVTQHPRQWAAVRAWLTTGPTLCVFDVDLDSPQLAEVERWLELPPVTGPADTGPYPGWTKPRHGPDSERIRGLENVPGTISYGSDEGSGGRRRAVPAPSGRTVLLLRPVGLGRVAALRTNEPLAPDTADFPLLLNALGPETWQWYRRHGFSFRRDNGDYWNLAVPGVGAAPVKSYLVLIALFAIVIGPVNYVLLQRRRRLYLLLVTVPGGAALVTLALLNYALISDGLGVRARVRSYTEIDQRRGQAVAWARQSYYAGLAPSQGLEYPPDAACYPIEHLPAPRRSARERRLIWDDEQRLVSGYLSSRSTAQLAVVRSRATVQGLQLDEPTSPAGPPRVTNQLGVVIDQLLLRDTQGRYYAARDIQPGQTFQPGPAAPEAVARDLRAASLKLRPSYPPGYDARYNDRRYGYQRRSYYWSAMDQNLPFPRLDESLLEQALNLAVHNDLAKLAPRSYLALTRTSPEIPLGYRSAREEASFHVVVGHW